MNYVINFRRNIYLGVMLIILFTSLYSCNKQLNAGPIDATYGAKFWVSKANVEKAVTAMYLQLRSNLATTGPYSSEGAFFVTGDLVSNLFVPAGGTFDQFLTQFGESGGHNFGYTPYWDVQLRDWSRFYSTIALCNEVLLNVPLMSSSLFSSAKEQQQYIAEAYFVRAYVYFYLCEVWGDPVYVSKTFDDADYGHVPPIARSPAKDVLDSCLSDLRFAQSSLSYGGGDPENSIRANKGSVQSLMANIFAWTHNYDSTHYYCQEVIKNGGYALEPMATYLNIWKGMASNESIFELPMLYNSNDPNFKNGGSLAEANFDFFATFLKGPIVQGVKKQCWLAPEGGTADLLFNDKQKHDLRFAKILSHYPIDNGDVAGYMLLKYTNFAFQQPSNIVGQGNYPYINNDLVLMRLSDMYLLDAEALASKGDLAGAKSALEPTEERAGIDNYKSLKNASEALEETIDEQGREFIGEGKWFYALIRTYAKGTEHTRLFNLGYAADRVDATGYFWPLNMTTLFPYDNLLTQNPWWLTHPNN